MKKDVLKMLEDQLQEDREKILEAYESLRSHMKNAQDFAISGQTLAKFAELLTKQTAQVLEIYKTQKKNEKPEDETLTAEDLQIIEEQIGNKKKWG
jgi:hypothetical protein